MRAALILAATTILELVSLPAYAEYRSIGYGFASCGTWTEARRDRATPRDAALEQWVVGFLSGVGYASEAEDPLQGLDADAVWGWMDNYCASYPLASVNAAASEFVHIHPK